MATIPLTESDYTNLESRWTLLLLGLNVESIENSSRSDNNGIYLAESSFWDYHKLHTVRGGRHLCGL